MLPIVHTAASGIISLIFASITKSLGGSIVCFLSGILIDIDHLIDFWIAKKKIILSYKGLFSFCAWEKEGKLYLIFHSLELLMALWLAIFLLNLNIVWVGFVIGLTFHLLLDWFSNPLRPWVYFFFYRVKHGFAKEFIYSREYYTKHILNRQ